MQYTTALIAIMLLLEGSMAVYQYVKYTKLDVAEETNSSPNQKEELWNGISESSIEAHLKLNVGKVFINGMIATGLLSIIAVSTAIYFEGPNVQQYQKICIVLSGGSLFISYLWYRGYKLAKEYHTQWYKIMKPQK